MARGSLCLAAAWALACLCAATALQFRGDGTFKIVQFTDLHFGEREELDKMSQQMITDVLKAEGVVDLIALSGDMVSGYAWDGTDGWYSKMWSRLTDVLNTRGVPYVTVLGNHDDEADLNRRQVAQLVADSGPLSLMRLGPETVTGASNYWLDIRARDGSKSAARLWMLDSMDQGCEWLPIGWGCVAKDTLDWAFDDLDGQEDLPSLAFIHIPLPQFMYAWLQGPANGSKTEYVGCPSGDWHSFRGVADLGVTAVYSGHDHNNNYVASYKKVRLAYGHKSGYGSYGPPAGWQRGARVIVLREGQDPALSETYIRLEDGSRLDQAPASTPTPVSSWAHQFICLPGFLPSVELPAAKFARCRQVTHEAHAQGRTQPDECREVYRLL